MPYVPASKSIPELTVKAVILGIILAAVMGAANAYLGLYVGMTVSASIPAAVISMAILRPLKGNILENNAVKTMAAAGEALAAGVIFTIPALLVLGVWTSIDLWVTTAAALTGGFLGVIFTIPLRRILIVDLDLPYPEGVACTEVLKTGEGGGKGMFYVFSALTIGLLFRLSGSRYGLRLFSERVEGVAEIDSRTRLFGGFDLSTALLGVGYIIGPRVSGFILGGGIIGWVILLPIAGMMNGYPVFDADGKLLDNIDSVFLVHRGWVIYTGIGMIIVGGLWTLFTMRTAIKKGIVEGILGKKKGEALYAEPIRTELDFPVQMWYFLVIGAGMFGLYWFVTGRAEVAGVATIMMLIASFFFTAIAGYLAGVIGSSNNPISGVTVATLLFTALLMLALGATGDDGMIATIVVAAIVCCSAAIAGDCMQELKTGQLLGSTPRALQISEFIGVITVGLIIAFIVSAIHEVYTIGSPSLPAPQAFVMAGVVSGIFEGKMNWAWFGMGIILAVGCIVFNHVQEIRKSSFQIPIMAVAIGIYLPLTLAVSIMLGGIIKFFAHGYVMKMPLPESNERMLDEDEEKDLRKARWERSENRGILFSSGLIAGEALMGVMIATVVLMGVDMHIIGLPAAWPGVLLFGYIAFLLGYFALREDVADHDFSTIRRVLSLIFRR